MKTEAFIFNWRGHESQAVSLERQLERFNRVTVINSEEKAAGAHPHWVHLAEAAYYSAQWNKAVELFSGDLLFQITADASCDDLQGLVERAEAVFERLPVGVYEPHVDFTDFTFDRKRLRNIEADLYEVPLTDGTCWFIRRDVVQDFPPVNTTLNKYGWGIVAAVAALSQKKKKLCVRDYSVKVAHPRSRSYSSDLAVKHREAYKKSLPPELRRGVSRVYRWKERVLEKDPRKPASWGNQLWDTLSGKLKLFRSRTQ